MKGAKNTGGKSYLPKGFPQGGNFSPFLSVVQLALLRAQKFALLLMYADDGLFYAMKRIAVQRVVNLFRDIGIEVNMEKSGWVRENWKWRKPLKFLGLEYDGVEKKLRASTREGATLEFDKHGLVDAARLARITGKAVAGDRP
jgi:hypothetical protein